MPDDDILSLKPAYAAYRRWTRTNNKPFFSTFGHTNRTKKMGTRQNTDLLGVGQPLESLSIQKLPIKSDILKRYVFLNQNKSASKQLVDQIVGCKRMTGSRAPLCSSENGCSQENPCLVSEVKEKWFRAGFPTISSSAIGDKITKLIFEQKTLEKQSLEERISKRKGLWLPELQNCSGFQKKVWPVPLAHREVTLFSIA